MNKKKTNIIMAIIIILIILILVLILLIMKLKKLETTNNNNKDNYEPDLLMEYVEDTSKKNVEIENSKTMLYIISNTINSEKNNYTFIKEIYKVKNDYISIYFILGIQENQEKYYIGYFDYENFTYEIEETIAEDFNDIKEGNIKNKYLEITTIENNGNNTFELVNMTDKNVVKLYFNIIEKLINSEPEQLYNILDTEYAQKRFGDINSFKTYINTNKIKYNNIELKKYAKYNYDEYIQYILVDSKENYYVINEITDGGYTVQLDTYTIDQPEFIKKYEAASDSDKAVYNINKFMLALNEKDYKFAYDCLAESFKQNNFNTIESFERYVKTNFFDDNQFEYTSANKESGYYIYKVNIVDTSGEKSNKTKEFIVNLKENREFELSFSIN